MDCNVCNNRTKALLVFTFQCYIICTFPADGSLYCQSDSVWTNLNDFLGSIKLAIFVVLRHLGILNPLSAPLQDLSLKNIRNHPLSTPLHYPYGLPAPWRATRNKWHGSKHWRWAVFVGYSNQGRRIRREGRRAATPFNKIMEEQNCLFAPPPSKSYVGMSCVVSQYLFMYA